MDAAVIISIISLVVAALIGGVSFYLAKQQLAAMNTQAEASKAQADAAKVQADASMIQAAATTEAQKQAVSWRAEEERRAEPQFRVTATRISRVGGMRDGQIVPPGENLLAFVAVVVENTSSRDATINHVGIEDVLSGSTDLSGVRDFGIEFQGTRSNFRCRGKGSLRS
ncbi:MAG: hypothetical protein WBL53_01090 [Pseudonocardiaceae bacterium]